MEELQARHRREQKEVQGRVTQKKKQASKKTRKGVNDECDRLEAELKQRQQSEISALEDGAPIDGADVADPSEQLEELTLHEPAPSEAATVITNSSPQPNGDTDSHDQIPSSQPKKPNRQKARLARRRAEQDEQARAAAEEAQHMPDLKQLERDRILASMKERDLQEKAIRADGHCLYSAVADQLEQLSVPLGSAPGPEPAVPYKIVRSKAADYIEAHADDFTAFLEEPLKGYLHKVRDTGEWGGQLELLALARGYGVDINVLQDFGRVERVEAGAEIGRKGEEGMWLGYYKHGFGLGEHYNSLRKAP